LASLRAAVPPSGQIVLESTPRGAVGCFYQEWMSAHETGYVRHFLPWWWEDAYRSPAASDGLREATAEELALIEDHGLSVAQILYRRKILAGFRNLAPQEYAEDPESCFIASGECVFALEPIEQRLQECVSAQKADLTCDPDARLQRMI